MGISATELAEAPVGVEEAPEGKKLAGRSPTQIALSRLRHDKVAVVCGVIVLILVLLVRVGLRAQRDREPEDRGHRGQQIAVARPLGSRWRGFRRGLVHSRAICR